MWLMNWETDSNGICVRVFERFVLFLPSALLHKGDPVPALTEALKRAFATVS